MRRLSIFVATLVAASVAVLSFPPSTASDAGRPPAAMQSEPQHVTPR
jgi:hypothetical protein